MTGRTGRIGNQGYATSFYNDRDEDIAQMLTLTLLETKQEIPEFLQGYVPEGGADARLVFDDDSDNEDGAGGESNDAAGGGGWGNDGNVPQDLQTTVQEAW